MSKDLRYLIDQSIRQHERIMELEKELRLTEDNLTLKPFIGIHYVIAIFTILTIGVAHLGEWMGWIS